MKNEIVLSVVILAYNHDAYIAQAIESILAQKTQFKYEIIVGEDCSSDKTRSIVRSYQKKHPETVKPIYYKHNMGGTRNLYCAIQKAQGKYIAFLDGDDFWCNDNRIESDVTFLEEHREYAGVCHKCRPIDEEGNDLSNHIDMDKVFNLPEGALYSLKDFEHWKLPGHFSCLTARNIFRKIDYRILYQASDIIGDRTIAMLVSLEGNIYRDLKIMSCYRYRLSTDKKNFTSDYINKNWRDKDVLFIRRLENWICRQRQIKINISEMKKDRLAASVAIWMKNPSFYNMGVVWRIIKYSGNPLLYLYYAVKVYLLKSYYWYILKDDCRINL